MLPPTVEAIQPPSPEPMMVELRAQWGNSSRWTGSLAGIASGGWGWGWGARICCVWKSSYQSVREQVAGGERCAIQAKERRGARQYYGVRNVQGLERAREKVALFMSYCVHSPYFQMDIEDSDEDFYEGLEKESECDHSTDSDFTDSDSNSNGSTNIYLLLYSLNFETSERKIF